VSDQGPGIASDQQGRIFDRFWQGNRTRGRGLGLGLSITRALVEMHGGRVWVESELGKGTRMCFTIPEANEKPAAVERAPIAVR
jgi:signal transduction histidine kinase